MNTAYPSGSNKTLAQPSSPTTPLLWLRTHWVMVSLVTLVIIGAGLRLYDLGAESLWQDEVTMIQIASDWDIVTEELSLLRPPFYVLLAYGWVQAFGDSAEIVRGLSMVASILAIVAVFYTGKELIDERVGLLAAFFMVFSGRQILHAQDFRYYAMLMLMAILSFYFFIRFVRHGRWRDGVPYILFAALTYYTHIFGIFIIGVQGLFFLTQWFVYKPVRLKWFLSQIGLLIAISPHFIPNTLQILGFNLVDVNTNGFSPDWMTLPGLTDPIRDTIRFLFFGYETTFIVLAGVLLLVGIAAFIVRRGPAAWGADLKSSPAQGWAAIRQYHSELLLIVLWLVIPVAAPFVLSFVLGPMYIDRYLFAASPALYLLLGVVIVAGRRLVPPALVMGVFLVVALPGLINTYYNEPTKEQWREAAALITEQSANQDGTGTIIVPTYDRQKFNVYTTFNWYYDGDMPTCQLIYERITEDDIARAFNACTGTPDTLYLALFRGDSFPVDAADIQALYPDRTMTLQAEYYDVDVYTLTAQPETEPVSD